MNCDTGDIISITRKGAEKVTRHDAESLPHLKSMALIPNLIRHAIFIDEEANEKDKNYCCPGKRPERPISSQPRAAPWVDMLHTLHRPGRAKALIFNAFALPGRFYVVPYTQGAALGYLLTGLSGRLPKPNYF